MIDNYNNWEKDFPWANVTDPFNPEIIEVGRSHFADMCDWAKGWVIPVYNMCAEINEVLHRNPGTIINIQQVKEKYGLFTMYYSASTEIYGEIEDIVNKCEEECKSRCYFCGKPATKVTSGWINFVCEEHALK